MPANVGEMFYTGRTPWHGQGLALAKPATVEEALKAGGLNWEVGQVDLMTADEPPSPVPTRRAIVRLDRPHGDENRVLGVAHRGFKPIQNREAAILFDAIFGRGRPVYHTGGYLGHGEVVWLLAKIDRPLKIAPDDIVEPYALMANSHDGSKAFNIRLTTIRVVCQNTLAMAMRQNRFGEHFRRSHQGTFRQHVEAAQEFFNSTLKELDFVAESFTGLTKRICSDAKFGQIIERLLPEPTKPRNADKNPGLRRAWENRVADVWEARKLIAQLRESGKGMDLQGSRGTFWGALNAVLEFVDHHSGSPETRLSYALMGDGMDLKVRAFKLIREEAALAA